MISKSDVILYFFGLAIIGIALSLVLGLIMYDLFNNNILTFSVIVVMFFSFLISGCISISLFSEVINTSEDKNE